MDETIVELYWERKESAIEQTEQQQDRGLFSDLVGKVVNFKEKCEKTFKSDAKSTQDAEPSPVLRVKIIKGPC